MDWDFDGEEFDEETKIRDEARKILELPDLPVSATCVRVPVMIGHAESVWIETERPLDAAEARELLAAAPSVRLEEIPTPGKSAGIDEVLVGRIRNDRAGANGITLHFASDNLREGRGAERRADRGDAGRPRRARGLGARAPAAPAPAGTLP